MSPAIDDIDWQSQEIIRTLFEHDQTLTSTQVRETTPIDDNRKILYRIENKLASASLVEVEQPITNDASVAPKEITLTDAGEEFGQRLADAHEEEFTVDDLPAQLEKLTATVDALEDRLDDLESRTVHKDAENINDQKDSIATLVTTITEFKNSSTGAWNDQETEEYELLRAGMLTLRDIVMEELDYSPEELDTAVQQHQRDHQS